MGLLRHEHRSHTLQRAARSRGSGSEAARRVFSEQRGGGAVLRLAHVKPPRVAAYTEGLAGCQTRHGSKITFVKQHFTALFLGCLWTLAGAAYADTEWRIRGFSSYAELEDGTVVCGTEYGSYYESPTGMVCTGGLYDSYHESRTGEVSCGGQYDSYHESRTGKVCAGGLYDSYHESRTGEVACGGRYDGYRQSRTGQICFGGLYRLRP